MKIQFELGQHSHIRHFTTIIEELERRGHAVIKTATTQDCPGLTKVRIAEGDHRSLMAFDAYIRDDDWGGVAYLIRTARDYLRYMKKIHADSLTIKERIRNMLEIGSAQLPKGIGNRLASLMKKIGHNDESVDGLDGMLAIVEEMIPPHGVIVDYLKSINADLICITPYIVTQYGQTDLIKAAKWLSKPVVFLVGSWDNLTSKGAVQVQPDCTLVWNEVQRDEAYNYHGLPKDLVKIVGAARFDDFWDRKVEIDQATYCREYGLDPQKLVITYLGSSNLISGDEKIFVQRWIDGLRASRKPILVSANVLLRPHPKFAKGWKDSFSHQTNVAVVISSESVVSALNNDSSLFHCLFHSAAVIGANTSAELEAAIVGKPIFTIEDQFFKTGQSGTIHFRYLAGPLARVASSLEEHYDQLEQGLNRNPKENPNQAFVLSFLRPGGLDRRAADVTADVLEGISQKDVLMSNREAGNQFLSKNSVRSQPLMARVKRLFSN
jgi:hypothetical protein